MGISIGPVLRFTRSALRSRDRETSLTSLVRLRRSCQSLFGLRCVNAQMLSGMSACRGTTPASNVQCRAAERACFQAVRSAADAWRLQPRTPRQNGLTNMNFRAAS